MKRGIGILAATMLCLGATSAPGLASPWGPDNPQIPPALSCDTLADTQTRTLNDALSLAVESLDEVCRAPGEPDEAMLLRAHRALEGWIAAPDGATAETERGRFYRALAALEAGTELFATDRATQGAASALVPEGFTAPDPEIAVYTLEEAAAPFLGPSSGVGTRVRIAVEADGYSDLFTIYFPRGTAHLTLPAQDMIALAAESVRGFKNAELWVSAGPALTATLARDRASAVEGVLLENEIPGTWVRVDDGSLEAILNRPESLASDPEL